MNVEVEQKRGIRIIFGANDDFQAPSISKRTDI